MSLINKPLFHRFDGQVDSFRQAGVQFNSIQFNSIQFNSIQFNLSFGLVLIEQIIQVPVIIPVKIATGLILIKASTDSSRGKIGGRCLGIGRSEAGFGCVAHRLAVSCAAGDALALGGVKIGLVDKPMLAKRSPLGSGLDFLGAVFWMGFLLPRLVILVIGLLFPPREFLVEVACSACPT
jgi:hypothetical protein